MTDSAQTEALMKLLQTAKNQKLEDRGFKCDDAGVPITVTCEDKNEPEQYVLLCELPLGHGGSDHRCCDVSWSD